MSDIYYFEDLSHAKKYEIAGYIATYNNQAHEKAKIAPVTTTDILESKLALVSIVNGAFAGFIRAKEVAYTESGNPCQQVGSLVVARAFLNQGIGTELIAEMTDEVICRQNTPYALCNQKSELRFAKVGYIPAQPGDIPPGIVSIYGNKPLVFPCKRTASV